MLHPSMFPRVHVSQLAPFSGDGRVYWAFDHLIAARPGALLLVPLFVVHGPIDGALHGCPVPWDEVCDVLYTERRAARVDVRAADSNQIAALANLAPQMWQMDLVRAGGGVAARFTHVSGITFALAEDLTRTTTTQAVSGDVTAADAEDSGLPGFAKKPAGGVTHL